MVRPEKLRVSSCAGDAPAGDGSPCGRGHGRRARVYLGTSTQLVVDVGDGVRMTVLDPQRRRVADRQTLPGGGARRRARRWEPEHMHVVIDQDEEEDDDGPTTPMSTAGDRAATADRPRAAGAVAATVVLGRLRRRDRRTAGKLRAAGGGSEVNGRAKADGQHAISNWPLYIDKKTVGDFEKETGVSVKYVEDVNSNEEFFAKLQAGTGGRQARAAAASSSSPTGWRRRCTNSATCRNSNRRRSRTSRRTCADNLRGARLRPRPPVRRAVAVRDDRDHRQQRSRRRTSTRSATCSTPSTRARSTC